MMGLLPVVVLVVARLGHAEAQVGVASNECHLYVYM